MTEHDRILSHLSDWQRLSFYHRFLFIGAYHTCTIDAMDDIGTYQEREFPAFRNPTLDTLTLGLKKHHIPCLFEVDVTEAREYMRELKARTGKGLSFTAWVTKCIGQAIYEHPHIQAMRKGKTKLILFEDVDISILVERAVSHSNTSSSATLPMPYIVRQANKKSVREIDNEIRIAQSASFAPGEVQVGTSRNAALIRIFAVMPQQPLCLSLMSDGQCCSPIGAGMALAFDV